MNRYARRVILAAHLVVWTVAIVAPLTALTITTARGLRDMGEVDL